MDQDQKIPFEHRSMVYRNLKVVVNILIVHGFCDPFLEENVCVHNYRAHKLSPIICVLGDFHDVAAVSNQSVAVSFFCFSHKPVIKVLGKHYCNVYV